MGAEHTASKEGERIMEPIKRAPAINDFLNFLSGESVEAAIRGGRCVRCKRTGITDYDFKDEVSRREFSISGFCQSCQDYVFTEEEE